MHLESKNDLLPTDGFVEPKLLLPTQNILPS